MEESIELRGGEVGNCRCGGTYSASWLAAQVLGCGQADDSCEGED
jgi:hypothetical protein